MICTLEDYELLSGTTIADPSGSEATLITSYLVSAQESMEKICNRKFEATDYAEVYKGNDSYELYLKNFPISTITSITYWDGLQTETLTVTDIHVQNAQEGIIYYPQKFYSSIYYTVTYSGGELSTSEQEELKIICYNLAKQLMEEKTGNLKAESLGDYSYVLRDMIEKNSDISNKLNYYKSYVL